MLGMIAADLKCSELGDIIKHAQTAGSANPSGRRQIPLRIDPPEKLDTLLVGTPHPVRMQTYKPGAR